MKNFIKISSKICAALLAVLGFSAIATSCVKSPPPMYGVPNADYFIDGKIVSEETNEPIKDLKVRFFEKMSDEREHSFDSVFTNAEGSFEFSRYQDLIRYYSIEVKDIDGEENGAFNDTTINVTINQNEFQGGDGSWYDGVYRKNFDIKLKPKN